MIEVIEWEDQTQVRHSSWNLTLNISVMNTAERKVISNQRRTQPPCAVSQAACADKKTINVADVV